MNRYGWLILPFLLSGCRSAGGPPDPVIGIDPGTIQPTAAIPGSSDRSWTVVPATQPRRYSSTATAALELLSDSGIIRETVTQRSRFTLLTASASGSTSFLGSVESVATDAPTRIGQPALAKVFPVTFTGHVSNGVVTLDALNGQPGSQAVQCSNPATSALNVIQRNLIILPTQLTQGMTWKDSTSAAGCTGSVPTTTISIRSYRVVGEVELSGRSAIAIERAEKTLSVGEGSENQHRILIKTEATGTARLYIDRVSGALLGSEGEQQAEVTVNTGRARRFRQVVKETVRVEN